MRPAKPTRKKQDLQSTTARFRSKLYWNSCETVEEMGWQRLDLETYLPVVRR